MFELQTFELEKKKKKKQVVQEPAFSALKTTQNLT